MEPDITRLFAARASEYAAHRPAYPPTVSAWFASLAPARDLAVDVGCGSGQLSVLLGDRFARVVACDASPEQIEYAQSHARVTYVAALAEHLPLKAAMADLIVAAQAAHWFLLTPFWAEARRVARRGAMGALVGYGLPRISHDVDAVVDEFHNVRLAAFWPPQRRYVVQGYAQIEVPFRPVTAPTLDMCHEWTLAQFSGYVNTWSAVGVARRRTGLDPMIAFTPRLETAWGTADEVRTVRWPIWLKAGTF